MLNDKFPSFKEWYKTEYPNEIDDDQYLEGSWLLWIIEKSNSQVNKPKLSEEEKIYILNDLKNITNGTFNVN